jgi:hypothetical protein
MKYKKLVTDLIFNENKLKPKLSTIYRQFQLLVYACRGRWEVLYHIADYAEKIKIVAV